MTFTKTLNQHLTVKIYLLLIFHLDSLFFSLGIYIYIYIYTIWYNTYFTSIFLPHSLPLLLIISFSLLTLLLSFCIYFLFFPCIPPALLTVRFSLIHCVWNLPAFGIGTINHIISSPPKHVPPHKHSTKTEKKEILEVVGRNRECKKK